MKIISVSKFGEYIWRKWLRIYHPPTPGTAQIESTFSTPAFDSICKQVIIVSFAVLIYVPRSIPCAIAGKADPCPRAPCGGNLACETTVRASSAVLICGTTIPLYLHLVRTQLDQRSRNTYCAPASNALLIKSGCVILRRTSGDTPKAAIAAVALCIESSLTWPCSQSMIIPLNFFLVKISIFRREEGLRQRQSAQQFVLREKMANQERS
jgi:hypothetical protein